MRKAAKTTQWEVPMRLEYLTSVLVEAIDAEEAARKAKSCEWLDDGLNAGELVDWSVSGTPRADS